jgi:hypothetical protein
MCVNTDISHDTLTIIPTESKTENLSCFCLQYYRQLLKLKRTTEMSVLGAGTKVFICVLIKSIKVRGLECGRKPGTPTWIFVGKKIAI